VSSYSIKDLEQLSGIKAHTLRVWEQRYNFIRPQRTDTNIRYYTDEDLKLILNISTLKDNGFKISKIADMAEDEMNQEVLKITQSNLRFPDQINSLTLAMIDLDEDRFEKIISTNVLKYGFEKTMMSIIYPFLSKIGVLWQTGSIIPAQEHFVSNLIRQKIIVAIDGQFVSANEAKSTYMLYLPEGELHEISLMFASYLLRARKNKVIYLGQTLPFEDVKAAYDVHQPKNILTIITAKMRRVQIKDYIQRMSETFPNSRILLSGYQMIGQNVSKYKNIQVFHKMSDLIEIIDA
jgi:MerR family transcriptional regulator, light-induced transcriptional regulator